MSLPFLAKNKRNIAGVIVSTRKQDGSIGPETEDASPSGQIDSCAQALIDSVKAGDVKGVAKAMEDAFKILESQPHEEGSDKPSPHTYEAQNIKAAE